MQPDVPIYAVKEIPKTLRMDVFDTLALFRRAISENRQVTFLYHTAQNEESMTAVPDATYTVSPYALFLADDRYCARVSVSGYGRLLHFRCDYMREVRMTEQAIRPCTELAECTEGLDVVGYVNRVIYGQDTAEDFILLCAGNLIDELNAVFGGGVRLVQKGDTVRAQIRAPWSAVRRFILGHLERATLLEPAVRQRQIRDELYTALSVYPQR